MCDQTEVSYTGGDVVWVKIGPIWWPGVVRDIEKDEEEKEKFSDLKPGVIAVVKFFDEDKYEFVMNLGHIYHYNCRKKDEFIKKGLDKFRSGAQHMIKFPGDITKAEVLVNGDADIVNDPKFAPAKKSDYSEIFSTGKKKVKKTEDKEKFEKKKFSNRVRSDKFARKCGDGRLERPPLKEQKKGPLIQKGFIYYCPFCAFSSTLVFNIASHVGRIHSRHKRVNFDPTGSEPVTTEIRKPKPRTLCLAKKRAKSTKPKETEVGEKTGSSTSQKSPVKKIASDSAEKDKKKRFTDALLADWSEDDAKDDDATGDKVDEQQMEVDLQKDPVDDTSAVELENIFDKKEECEKEVASEAMVETPKDILIVAPAEKKETASCFDFDDEEEGFIGMSNANTYGRKIPRVIPVKDKTDLGMDLDIEEIFKRKPDNIDEADIVTEAVEVDPKPKRKGRRRKSEIEADAKNSATEGESSPKKIALPVVKTLAATRDRRPGARKSYLKEVIEKIDDNGKIVRSDPEDETPSKPSRRKQDLKRQSLVELDELDLEKKKEELLRKKASEDTELAAKMELVLAETAAPSLPQLPKVQGDAVLAVGDRTEEELGFVEYLEEDVNKGNIGKSAVQETSKIVWKGTDGSLQASITSKWKQELRDALNANKDGQPKEITVGTAISSEPRPKVLTIKGPKIVQQKGSGTLYLLNPPNIGSRPKILGKSQGQQIMLVSNPISSLKGSTGTFQSSQRLQVVSPLKTTATSPLVISEHPRSVQTLTIPKRIIQLKNCGNSSIREGGRLIENYNGTGKTVLITDGSSSGSSVKSAQVVSGQSVLGVRKKVTGEFSGETSPCFIKRIKGKDGKYTIQKIVRGVRMNADGTYMLPQNQQRTQVIRRQEIAPKPELLRVISKPVEVPEPIVEQLPVLEQAMEPQPPVANPQQVMAIDGPLSADGQPTYVIVAMDENGIMQPVDNPIITYDTQGQLVQQDNGVMVVNATEHMNPTPNYSTPGQDILAEALANTNVLVDTEPSLSTILLPSVISDPSVNSPILTSLGMSPSVMADSPALIISPVVQETSVTLQKPIMTPVEVPSNIIADTSGFEPPPLPPTPTEEDVLMDEPEGGLMIAEQQGEEEIPEPVEAQEANEPPVGQFFIDDSQGEEANSFQSMPLLNEESTASEEPIGDQNFDAQSERVAKSTEYLPTSTEPDLEEPNEEAAGTQEDLKEGAMDMAFVTEEGFPIDPESHRPQETEVSSTTGDSKDSGVS